MKKPIFYFLLMIAMCGNKAFAQRDLTLDESKQPAWKNNVESKNSKLEIKTAQQIK